jgi:hypothetical protein
MGENNPRQDIYPVTRKFGFWVALCTSPIFIVFIYLGDSERGKTAWFSAMIILMAIRMFWNLRKRVRFWITITIITLLHILLVFFIPWPFKEVPYVALMPVGLLDLAIAYGAIRLVEKAMRSDTASSLQ